MDDIARELNPMVRRWIAYYGQYTRSALYPLACYINQTLAIWLKRKYKRFHHRLGRARLFLERIAREKRRLFVHCNSAMAASLPDGSRVRRESHARFCERLEVKSLRPTHPTVPVLAKGKTRTARLWPSVRDDRPFAGPDPPAAVFFYSPDRGGAHPEQHLAGYAGLMQADAYAGFGRLYEANRKGGPIIEAACWAHGRRKFFDLARLTKAPIAAEAVKRIDVLFAIEREINGFAPEERLRVRQERSRHLIVELEAWLRERRAKLSRNNDTTKAINYCLSRWDAFSRFLDDGRLCMSTDDVEKLSRQFMTTFFGFSFQAATIRS
ncbi:hypothetical protein ABIA45_007407 [Bradyrhizobium sp. USDA 336]